MRIELTIEELVVTGISATNADRVRDAVASELYEIERALQHASRRLQRVIDRA